MTTTWLPAAKVDDLRSTRGNGPFGDNGSFLGVVLHVNVDEHGTSDSFFSADGPTNPNEVTPNFQVYKSEAEGGIHQYLPFDWQPWCQADGNYRFAAIETAGETWEPLTAYQLAAIASILAVYHSDMGMPLIVTDSPSKPGFGTHQMGGEAWGGHPCPGTIRAGQRQAILNIAAGKGDIMSTLDAEDLANIADAVWAKTFTAADDGKPYAASKFLIAVDNYAHLGATAAAQSQRALTAAGSGVIATLASLRALISAKSSAVPAGPTTVPVTGTLTLGSEK